MVVLADRRPPSERSRSVLAGRAVPGDMPGFKGATVERLLDAHGQLVDLLETGSRREAASSWHSHFVAVRDLLGMSVDTGDAGDLER